MATPASAYVSKKSAAFSSSANKFSRQPTLQKLELLASAEKRSPLSGKSPGALSRASGGEELLRILGRQRVRVDKSAIHFVSEPAQRRSSVIRSTPTKANLGYAKGENSVEKGSEDLEQEEGDDVSTEALPVCRRESVFRMAPAAAGRTIIARVGAPRAEWLTCKSLKNNHHIMRRFTVDSSAGHSEDEQEDWGGEEDAVDAATMTGKEDGGAQRQKTAGSRAVGNTAQESKARLEQKEQLLANVAAALHAEIEQTLKEGKEAVVTTEPYNADEPTDITMAVTKIKDMAAEVERLSAAEKQANDTFTETSQSTDISVSDTTAEEQGHNGRFDVVLTDADFNVLESLQQAFVRSNLIVWLDQMKTIYAHGVRLLRVNVLGKMFIRIVTIQDGCIQLVPVNAQAKSRRTVALSIVETVMLGKNSREFRALKDRIAAGDEVAEADPPATACAVIVLSRNRTVSLLFMDELQRNGFVFALRVWSMWAKAALREMEWGP